MTPGTPLGSYEILSPLGKDGMGEVWRPRDQKLGREVAIKTLPEEFAKDEERPSPHALTAREKFQKKKLGQFRAKHFGPFGSDHCRLTDG